MEVYRNSTYRSFLEKEPDKYFPPKQLKEVEGVTFLKPSLVSAKLYKYPNEHTLVLEGNNLWFCHQIKVGEGKHMCCIDTPAQYITHRSIEFNYTPSDQCEIITDASGKVKIAVYSHFAKPIRCKIRIEEEPYTFSQRQMQLAKHTPSEVIELAYWSAALECNSDCGSQHTHSPSKRFTAVTKFLEEAVRVVPIESIFFAIAHCDLNTSTECSKAVVQSFSKSNLPPSGSLTHAAAEALCKMQTGLPLDFFNWMFNQMMGAIVQMEKGATRARAQPTYAQAAAGNGASAMAATAEPVLPRIHAQVTLQATMPSPAFLGHKMQSEVPPLDHSTAMSLIKLLKKIIEQGSRKIESGRSLNAVCGFNIERVYPIYPSRGSSLHPSSSLQSPMEVLKQTKEKLSSFAEEAKHDSELMPGEGYTEREMTVVDEMLGVVKDIRENHLRICASLLSAFMESQIRIPLLNNPAATAKVLSSKAAPVAMGVWALFSMSFADLQRMLQSTEDNELFIQIADYISGILAESDKPSQSKDRMYAGKLQFLLRAMQITTCCNRQYISYSLEHQLHKNLKFDPSIPVEELTDKWNTIFKDDALSLVAKPYRSLIARWLKWALLIHDLRESLAKYTCIGVVGLVNSGKSQLVNSLFRVQALVGTTGKVRTTIPFLYNLDGTVDGLDVIDFPGVDDHDHCIPELTGLLIGLAQIVIFVVNYRKISTSLAKEWLRQLQIEDVPLLVCLTHADRLYAECMKKDQDPNPNESKRQVIGSELQRIKEDLGHHPSRTVEMCCFGQDPDSLLTLESLRKVGIKSPQDVGDWLVQTFRSKFDQTDLADKLHHFIHCPEDMKTS